MQGMKDGTPLQGIKEGTPVQGMKAGMNYGMNYARMPTPGNEGSTPGMNHTSTSTTGKGPHQYVYNRERTTPVRLQQRKNHTGTSTTW